MLKKMKIPLTKLIKMSKGLMLLKEKMKWKSMRRLQTVNKTT